ncbi:MAG: hypothetical protein GY832_10420 [Chloroflexi bacterium]|nr:hypothetical protein [Chloroflexota bacterium]
MDNLDLYGEEELYEDEDEEAIEEEGSNRTFIMLAGGLGGLLAITICIFLVWALVISPRMATNRVAENDAIATQNAEAMALMATDTVAPEPTEEPAGTEPTEAAPEPTDTVVPPTATRRPTATPQSEDPTETSEEAADATPEETVETSPENAADATEETATPRPQATSRPTATPSSRKSGVPETGIGTFATAVLAVGLMFLLFAVRRMRQAV